MTMAKVPMHSLSDEHVKYPLYGTNNGLDTYGTHTLQRTHKDVNRRELFHTHTHTFK